MPYSPLSSLAIRSQTPNTFFDSSPPGSLRVSLIELFQPFLSLPKTPPTRGGLLPSHPGLPPPPPQRLEPAEQFPYFSRSSFPIPSFFPPFPLRPLFRRSPTRFPPSKAEFSDTTFPPCSVFPSYDANSSDRDTLERLPPFPPLVFHLLEATRRVVLGLSFL